MTKDEIKEFIINAPKRRAEAIERWANNKELQRSLRGIVEEDKAQERYDD